jgi:hypothetical protein
LPIHLHIHSDPPQYCPLELLQILAIHHAAHNSAQQLSARQRALSCSAFVSQVASKALFISSESLCVQPCPAEVSQTMCTALLSSSPSNLVHSQETFYSGDSISQSSSAHSSSQKLLVKQHPQLCSKTDRQASYIALLSSSQSSSWLSSAQQQSLK